MEQTAIEYAICGGHAIDLFLDVKTRPHKDLDVSIFQEDRDKIISYMLNKGWDIYEPYGTEYLHKINNIENQKRLKLNIWCVKPNNPHYIFTEHENNTYDVIFDNSEQSKLNYIEFLFNTQNDGKFLYSRNHNIGLNLDEAILQDRGIPYIAPEMVLLYKSTAIDNFDYQLDFENASIKMNDKQLMWLKDSLQIMFPNGHKWIDSIILKDR